MTAIERVTQATRASAPFMLATPRLRLRPPCGDDAERIAALLNDRRISENLARAPYPYSIADAHQFISLAARDDELRLVITLADGTLIGAAGIAILRADGPEIGYWLGVPYWGQGYATETARALVDHAFAELGHDWLMSGARVTNGASRAVLEKCGFEWIGVVLQRSRALGTSVPADRFRLDRTRWDALRRAAPRLAPR
jgi:RimJ/RimL family protein N-acetyltransferase